ncbi:hypothetical protein RAS2_07090 [Phycisphaerae bacterium RAS2]|nr:hypothetical protein RAS2_07090 [Phycisphaerae bacterium RAS2]
MQRFAKQFAKQLAKQMRESRIKSHRLLHPIGNQIVRWQGERARESLIRNYRPTGLVARRGVSIHDGHWEEDDPKTPKVDESGWVPGSVNSMCDYVCLADGMGNVRGRLDSNGNVSIQTFDSFGNAQGTSKLSPDQTYVDFRCNNDCDFGDPKGYKNARPPSMGGTAPSPSVLLETLNQIVRYPAIVCAD